MGRLTRHSRPAWALVAAAAAVLVAAQAATGTGPGIPTLTVAITPNILTAGGSDVAVVSFTNNGPAVEALKVTLTFPSPVDVRASSCSAAAVATTTVVCTLGHVAEHATATAAIPFTAPSTTGPFLLQGVANFIVTGKGSRPGVLNASDSGTVFASDDPAHKGSCTASPSGSTTATADSQTISLNTLPTPSDASLQQLGCTPVGVGVDPPPAGFHTDSLSVVLPQLTTPAELTLLFPDGFLPGGFDAELPGTLPPLHELNDQNVDLGPVPSCPPFPSLPAGRDACIISTSVSDEDGDSDAGKIVLRVQGSGFGDPRFAG